MNLFAALVEEEFLAALLFLRDIFDIITYLIHYVYLMLKYILAIKGHWFDEENFKKLKKHFHHLQIVKKRII